jgi:uncharacterized protein YlxP (DUF503 family)
VSLQIPISGSLKAKRQVLRRVSDRVKAKFNVSVAEVADNDLWQKATVALAVVGNERAHVNEQMDKILDFIEEMYVAPVMSRQLEIIPMGDELFGEEPDGVGASLEIPTGQRSLAEAEGMGAWEHRHQAEPPASGSKPSKGHGGQGTHGAGKQQKGLSLEEARARARALRNPREWEKK